MIRGGTQMKEKSINRYYKFTKFFYVVWFVVALITLFIAIKSVIDGNFEDRLLVFRLFSSAFMFVVGLSFYNLNIVFKSLLTTNTLDFKPLERILSFIKALIVIVFLYGCIGYNNGIGLDTINLSPDMILLLSLLIFVFIILKLIFIYRDIK